jgi:hypothetical protein
VATADLLRAVDASHAARRLLDHGTRPSTVVFSIASSAEHQIVDRMLQRAGAQTVDLTHGYSVEANLRTAWRTSSTHLVSWSQEQAREHEAIGGHKRYHGGYLPRTRAPRLARGPRPRCLILSNYVDNRVFPQNAKYARRLARAAQQLAERVAGRVDVRVRLHPHEPRAPWMSTGLTISTEAELSADLAWADVVASALSSTLIETLLYDVPVLLHRALLWQRGSLFDCVPDERWFRDGGELITRVEALVASPPDLGPERRLRTACFGPKGEPRDPLQLLDELEPWQVPSTAVSSAC